MIERNYYTLQDVKDYLYENYELDWKNFKVLDGETMRGVRQKDFKIDYLSMVAVVYKQGKRVEPITIRVSDKFISVGEFGVDYNNWQEFLSKRNSKYRDTKLVGTPNYTLEYIKEFIKKKCCLDWNYSYYDNETNKTSKLTLGDFERLGTLELVVRKNGHVFLQPTLVNNNTFKLLEGDEIKDYSKAWKIYIDIKNCESTDELKKE